jgi:hypothetical protein
MFSLEAWLAKSGGFYNGVATQSLRFDRGGSTYLNRTPSSTTNNSKWTWSGWVKRGNLDTAFPNTYNYFLFGASPNSTSQSILYYNSTSNSLGFYIYNGSSFLTNVSTDAIFRDTSAWYHVVFIFDCANTTASDRVIFYVNGERQTTDTTASTSASYVNQNVFHTIGIDARLNATLGTFDGYMAEINFVDGLALDPTYFGETKNGVWIPKKYTGSYGTNGFRLQFIGTGTSTSSGAVTTPTNIGDDSSGNNHHFAVASSGLSAHDSNMSDSPENNFCTWNPLRPNASMSYSEGNLNAISSGGGGRSGYGTIGMSTGKWYFETLGGDNSVGIADTSAIPYATYSASGSYNLNGTTVSSKSTYTTSDIISVAYDADGGNIEFFKNGSSEGSSSFTDGQGFDLVAQFNGKSSFSRTCTANFGQDSSFAGTKTAQGNTDGNGIGDFYYAPPSGYLALCTSNLPEPTISPNADTQADDYFNTVLWNGNNSTQSITGVGFQPDWLWIKNRTSSSFGHSLTDSSRGANEVLSSDTLDDEFTNANNVNAFTSDGFNLGNTSFSGYSNQTGSSYVGWNWKANGGTTSSNTDGSITSTVQANTTAGFSIVQYVATGSNATIGHGLSVEPDTVWVKNRDTNNRHWMSYWKPLGATDRMIFTTADSGSTSTSFNNTSPTSTVFSIGTSSHVNDASDNYIAYCFHSVEGYSKIGSYTGNGSTDGTFVFTGFRPAFCMWKRTDTSGGMWQMMDTTRDTFNVMDLYLQANSSNDEADFDFVDFVSNGFKHRHNSTHNNASGGTYIYMAFAETPFKYANAR